MTTNQIDELRHHCGVVGLYSKELSNLPEKLFYTLYSLQHRGQEGAGITFQSGQEFQTKKGLGLVSQVLTPFVGQNNPSRTAIGHVRYSTHGGNAVQNVQPIHITCNKGEIALAHNGNISNLQIIKDRLDQDGAIFQTTSDTETVLHLLSRSRRSTFMDCLVETLQQLQGAFSMVMMNKDDLYAVRDPKGFRPLYMGWNEDLTVFVSETCALDILGITQFREVEPGELILVNENGIQSFRIAPEGKKAHCIFEFIYFARPDSQIFGHSVYGMRKAMGKALARVDPIRGDVVIPVPDSGNSAALGYAEEKGIPFEMGMTRNHFAGRSFTLPSQAQREFAVKMKLNPIRETIQGKVIILVDDSLVRGTTSKFIVKLLRDAGAKEIHLRLSSPEIKYPCFYGIDIPTRKELISNSLDPEALAKHIGADSVIFLPLLELHGCTTYPKDYCDACFSGNYPEPLSSEARREIEL